MYLEIDTSLSENLRELEELDDNNPENAKKNRESYDKFMEIYNDSIIRRRKLFDQFEKKPDGIKATLIKCREIFRQIAKLDSELYEIFKQYY